MSMRVSSPASAHQRRRGTLTYSAAQIPPAASRNHRALGAARTQESRKSERLQMSAAFYSLHHLLFKYCYEAASPELDFGMCIMFNMNQDLKKNNV